MKDFDLEDYEFEEEPFFTIEEDGKVVFEISMTEADDDWIRAGRLRVAAEKGDDKARKELERIQNSKMVSLKEKKPEK